MDEILEAAAVADLDFEEVEDAILHNILVNNNQPPRNRGQQYGRFNLQELTEKEIELNFRFKQHHLQRLCNALGLPGEIRAPDRHVVDGIEGLCILLRRLTYPNRLSDLEQLFGLSSQSLSYISNTVMHLIYDNHNHLLHNLRNLRWLNLEKLQYYAEAIRAKGSPLHNCWGFIDGTARAICRPSIDQENYYSGHKRFHCVKYQSVLCPDGIVASLIGAYPGRRHDAGIFRESHLYAQMEECTTFPTGEQFVLYGDQAYGIRELLLCPYSNRRLTPQQQNFNHSMSSLRQAVEWGFGKIIAEFAFLDFKKNQKLLLQDIAEMYTTGMILINCHTCLYGSQTASYFHTNPPTLEEYLNL